MHRAAAAQAHSAGPERIIGAGHQHLVAGVEQCLQRHDNELGDTVAQEHVLWADASHAASFEELSHSLPGRLYAACIAITLGVGDVLGHAAQNVAWCIEAKGSWIAQVQLDDLVPVGLELASPPQHWPAYVIPDVAESACLG